MCLARCPSKSAEASNIQEAHANLAIVFGIEIGFGNEEREIGKGGNRWRGEGGFSTWKQLKIFDIILLMVSTLLFSRSLTIFRGNKVVNLHGSERRTAIGQSCSGSWHDSDGGTAILWESETEWDTTANWPWNVRCEWMIEELSQRSLCLAVSDEPSWPKKNNFMACERWLNFGQRQISARKLQVGDTPRCYPRLNSNQLHK